ncbi:MAG TPA: hypothetical protein VFR31_13855 [Thermoanaerobaculia bacterium]|nr:hypothetical protein [Thermoanaerobaculia bacterium]
MGSNLSIAAALARMEAKIAHHKAQHEHHAARVAHHAAQLALHGEQKALHEEEHRKAVEVYESFKAASVSVGEMIVDIQPAAPYRLPEDIEVGKWRWLSKLMSRLIESKAADEVFGPSTLIREIRQHWGTKLRRPIDPRSVSATLRRWAAAGQIRLVRDGRSYHESLYTRG